MASEDVIELGSSDDETEPALKKVKPNTMVHIPHKFSGSSSGSTKHSLPSIHKKLSGGSITIKKITSPQVTEVKNKINILRKSVVRPTAKPIQKLTTIKQALNPISVKMTNSQVAVNRVLATSLKEPIKVSKFEGTSFNSLPSSITVRKALPSHKYTTTNMQNKPNKNIKILPKATLLPKITILPNPLVSKSSVGDVLTVELDDDDAKPEPPNTKGPQWYLRPEEQKQEIMEEQNNMEPKPSKFIEITIEDSPSKPINNTHEIGAEFAITIEDSPIKFTTNKKKSINCSDEENKAVPRKPKTKKKLEYPKKNANNTTKTVEIEIEPMEVDEESQGENRSMVHSNNIEIDLELPETISKDNNPESTVKVISTEDSESKKMLNQNNHDNEFHPVYQNFIDLCFTLENSEDMQKIVEKKIKGYYRQVPKEFRESEEFLDMVSSKIISMKAGPEKMYLYIKDVVDELNFKRKSFKTSTSINRETNDKEAEKFFYGDESEFDSKRQRQIRKLEKTLKKLHRAIQKLEEQEVDFDDEEDSVYLLTERYKERMIRVHAKFCQLTNTKMPSEPRVHVEARPGQPTGPAKRLEKMINKKVPIGKPLPFPDFHDVLRCVREANDEDKLCWNEADIMEEARDLFVRCGKKLQRRRQENEWRLAASRISAELDPAKDSDELKMKLEQNKLLAIKKETELFNKYADKQNQMKLEAVEIGDKEAEESPVESEDDDVQEEDGSLENSEKRKEGLKRLLQKKFTKDSEKSEDRSINESNTETKLEDSNKNLSSGMNVQNEESTCIKINSVESLSETINIDDKIQSLSDDSSKINSDIDELHLLQILHSGNEINDSTQNSSDSDSFIAISDSLDSSSDSKKLGNEDVISIENSSYSESEANEVENIPVTNPAVSATQETPKEVNNLDIECSTSRNNENKCDKRNNDEYNESVENILLASSDEECESAKKFSNNQTDANVYLNDDSMSRRKTIIEEKDSKDNIHFLNGKVDDVSSIKQSNDISKVDVEKKTDSDVQEIAINNDKKKSNEHVLIENHVNNFKDSNITSTKNNESINMNIKLDAGKKNISNRINGEQNTECDSVENVVGSSTEAMEVVTTTTPCDDVNG